MFGIVLLDAAVGKVHFYQFLDDKQLTYFQTLILQTKPKEFIFLKEKVSQNVLKLTKRLVVNPCITFLSAPKKEGGIDVSEAFWLDYADVVWKLENEYFDEQPMPECLQELIHWYRKSNESETEAGEQDLQLTFDAFCGCLGYLESLLLAKEILQQGNIATKDIHSQQDRLILDCTALKSLEIFENSLNGGKEGTLIQFLDHCVTSFGKRHLRQLICRPFYNPKELNRRLDAIEDLRHQEELKKAIQKGLSGLPDLERLNSRMHSRAIRLPDFLNILKSYEEIHLLILSLRNHESYPHLRSYLLTLFSPMDNGVCDSQNNIWDNDEMDTGEEKTKIGFPDLSPLIELKNSLNFEESVKQKAVCPLSGFRENFDNAKAAIQEIEDELEEYLKHIRISCGLRPNAKKDIEYGKSRNVIVVSESVVKSRFQGGKKVPDNLTLEKKNQKNCHYSSNDLKKLVAKLEDAHQNLEMVTEGLFSELLTDAVKHIDICRTAVSKIAEIDLLCSLATVSFESGGLEMCRPQFENAEKAFIRAEHLRHPYLYSQGYCDMVVPNNISLGKRRLIDDYEQEEEEDYDVLVLTGPNMGGKSTLLRQTCLAVIMAQLGCYVPASSCSLSSFDRIFVRAGAQDDIVAGQSTFMVELLETGNILDYATRDSLIVLDELGRGTSTWDGYALAYAVIQFFCQQIDACVMFSTHYHSLVEELKDDKRIGLFHMSCYVEEEISFLYTLERGLASCSFGMNVAQMAGIPDELIQKATKKATEESETQNQAKIWKTTARLLSCLSSSPSDSSHAQLVELARRCRLLK